MKNQLLTILTIILFPVLCFSQKNDISLEGLYWQHDNDYIFGTNINYFRNISPKSSVGAMFHISKFTPSYLRKSNPNGELDILNAWSIMYKNKYYTNKRSTLFFTAGLNFTTTITYYKTIPRRYDCGSGPNLPPAKPLRHWNFEYFAGPLVSLGYQYELKRNIYLVINLYGEYLYDFEFKEFCPLIVPVAGLGYKW